MKKEIKLRFEASEIINYRSILEETLEATKKRKKEILEGEDLLKKLQLVKHTQEATIEESLFLTKEEEEEIFSSPEARELQEKINSFRSLINKHPLIIFFGLRVTLFERSYYKLMFYAEMAKEQEDNVFFYFKHAGEEARKALLYIKSFILALANFGEEPFFIYFAPKAITNSIYLLLDLGGYPCLVPKIKENYEKFISQALLSLEVSEEQIKKDMDLIKTML